MYMAILDTKQINTGLKSIHNNHDVVENAMEWTTSSWNTYLKDIIEINSR